ncbi:alanine--tRNA ligase [Candidatus Margulisiibacteriota bacterium]
MDDKSTKIPEQKHKDDEIPTSKEIRKKFINFFKELRHTEVKSSPVVPTDDPTLLFTNAGMNQFKDVFLGTGKRDYKRAVNTQKCIRVSGKHNDLEEVGKDTYHHTFFEMLGNWSFGNYYKKEAIAWAWELFTKVYKLPKEILYATVYETDDEAEKLWKNETDIDPKHIMPFGKKDNFWEMGDTGPCGPCSEIHIDLGSAHCDKKSDKKHKCGVNSGCGRYIELWNLVFIQYNCDANGKLNDLPHKHVDTGAGLERICAVLQKKKSNYDTDLFQDIIQETAKISGVKYGQNQGTDIAHRVIADHIRALTFAITDGASPSNEGRGYVMRRILRRAARFGRNLNLHDPFLYKLIPAVINTLGETFPEIITNEEYITKIIKSEEISFGRTLDKGISYFEEAVKQIESGKVQNVNKNEFPGGIAFLLYDTYGFPLDLTELMAQEKGLTVNKKQFNNRMRAQKERSRKAGMAGAAKGAGGEVHQEGKTPEEKKDMEKNHTATHLLHAALQQVLGKHATQAGSLVEPKRLRFDFKHFQGMTPEEIKKAEDIVNAEIKKAPKVEFINTTFDEAKKMGAMALFGEKYGDEVRVVKIGDFSMELCGGHHLKNIGEIGNFKITSEGAIAAGTRRIEAVTGKYVDIYLKEQSNKASAQENKLMEAFNKKKAEAEKLGLNVSIPKNAEEITACSKKIEKEISKFKQDKATAETDNLLKKKIQLNKITVLVEEVSGFDSNMLKTATYTLSDKLRSGIVFLAANNNGKLIFSAKVTDDLVKKGYNAGNLVKEAAKVTGGGGGGRPEAAQAGGKDASKLPEAIEKIKELIKNHK